jgi:hypothetical protein
MGVFAMLASVLVRDSLKIKSKVLSSLITHISSSYFIVGGHHCRFHRVFKCDHRLQSSWVSPCSQADFIYGISWLTFAICSGGCPGLSDDRFCIWWICHPLPLVNWHLLLVMFKVDPITSLTSTSNSAGLVSSAPLVQRSPYWSQKSWATFLVSARTSDSSKTNKHSLIYSCWSNHSVSKWWS